MVMPAAPLAQAVALQPTQPWKEGSARTQVRFPIPKIAQSNRPEEILVNAKRLDEHLAAQNQSYPSFDHDALVNLSPQMELARNALIDSTHTLKQLAQGPMRATVDIMLNYTEFLALRAVYAYRLPQAVPIDGCATYQEIASACGLSESMTRRFLRHAIAIRVFAQSSPNEVRHTAASRLMATDPDFFDAVGMETSELGPPSASFIDALSRYGESGEQNETAFSLANGTSLGIYQFLGQHPERARRLGAGMRFFTRDEGWNSRHLVAGFDWASIDYPDATVVDVGGGQGGISQVLAKATENLKFIVLDLPGTVEQGKAALPKEYRGRIEFMAHDFFAELNLKKAPEVYLFRWIFHNWSDGYCVKILQKLIPSLGEGTRLLIYECLLNDEPDTRTSEKMMRALDMIMAICYNSAERTKAQWTSLLQSADERFVIENIVRPEGSTMSIIEVAWKKA